MRSGTAQLLHISEFGKVCAKFPEKAREIITGAMEAIHTENSSSILFIESTAEAQERALFTVQVGARPLVPHLICTGVRKSLSQDLQGRQIQL